MPDFGAPIAQNVDVNPNKGLTTLSDLMGLQQKQIGIQQAQQTLQTGQAVQASAQAEAQKNQQAMGERQLLQSSMQNGKDPDGNPLVDANGEADPVAMGKFATKYMPLTGQAVVQNLLKTTNDKLSVQSGALKLDAQQRNMIAGPMQALNLDPSDDNITNARGAITGLVTAHPEMAKTAASANALLDHVQNTPDPQQRKRMANSLSALFQPGAAIETQPSAAQVDTGPTIQPGVREAPAAGAGFTPTGAPITKGVAPGIVMDLQGQPHYIGGAAGLGGGGAGGAAPSPWPTPAGVQAQSGVAKDMSDHFTGLNASAQSLPLVTGLTKTIESLAPSAFTGPGGDKKQYMAGILRGFHINATGDAQTDTNLLNKAMAQLNISTPAGTDAARALVEAGQPNSHMDPDAIKEAAGTLRGQVMMNQAERNFLQTTRLSNRGAGDPQAYQEGRQQFEAQADPRIWQYHDLANSNPAAARTFIRRQPDGADLVRKSAALEQMGFFR
jgi:hypothetical protein